LELTKDIPNWRVLVIDDEPDNLFLVVAVLQFKGATTESATNGAIGLGLVDSYRPNLILLDLSMPILDGFEVHRRLRSRPELDDIPIVALTALAMPADAEKVHAAGFDGYITKPFRVMDLLSELQGIVSEFLDRETALKPTSVRES
jgi:CheY-like chemotaxis protein